MRDRIIFILPFVQIIIALVTLYRLPAPPPQYFCEQGKDAYGNTYPILICNPK